MFVQIIHKDRHLLVLNKPAGMPIVNVNGGSRATLVNWLVENFPKQKKLGEEAGPLHRLDNNTSGLIVVARNKDAYDYLKEIWNSGKVIKEYISLVLGQTPPNGKITTLIAHHPDKKNKMVTVDTPEDAKQLKARYAYTEYSVIETYFDYTLLKVIITTGVRHQIRCHLSSIGHPIAGDKLYQRTKHLDRDWLKLQRQFLHSSRISFPHPKNGRLIEFVSALPADLQNALDKLKE